MIVFHDFFYKSHPHYLDRAIGMMEFVNNCGFIDHGDLKVFIKKLKFPPEHVPYCIQKYGNISKQCCSKNGTNSLASELTPAWLR